MPFFMAGFEIAAYGSSESGIELERGLEEFNVAAVKLVEEAREIPEELCTIEVDPSSATADSGWAGAAGGVTREAVVEGAMNGFPLFLPGCEEVFLKAVLTRLEEAFTISSAVVPEC